ncbi:MAG: hypothetical protein A3F17_03745 [Gammaproteobacteria bacterium RIFCSPHIGHO2_12_FULL_41_15]|nr:MAG: hypothetical protein A3F17_03745 [Gammaproteobacteria bacterium RIFCSPHIGHO2_12_FULL_41_15]
MNMITRTCISVIAAMVILLIVMWTMPVYPIIPRGIVLPVNGINPPITTDVSIYDSLNAPFNAKVIGILSLMYYSQTNSTASQMLFSQAATEFVKEAGGNGLQVIQAFYIPPGTPSGGVNILRGKVILTK